MIHLIAYGFPVFIAALAVPMILGMVPPNDYYGFRTPKTLSAPEVWYPANRVSGWVMIAAMVLTVCFNLSLWKLHPDWPHKRLLLWMANASPVFLLLGLGVSLFYLRKL